MCTIPGQQIKHSRHFTESCFGTSFLCSKSQSISTGSICSSKNKVQPLPQWKQSNIIILAECPGDVVKSGAQCQFLLLVSWISNSNRSQVQFGECYYACVLKPCMICMSTIMSTVFMSSLGSYKNDWRTWLMSTH